MKKLLFGLCLLASSAHATWTLVQHPIAASSCTQSITCSLTLTQATGSGNVIIVEQIYGNGSQATISSVSGGGTYTAPPGCSAFTASPGIGTNCAYTLNSTSGATSISVTTSIDGFGMSVILAAREYTFSGSTIIDSTGAIVRAACTSCTGIGLTLTGANDVIVQELSFQPTNTVSAISAPYTTLDTSGRGGVAHLLNTTSGTAPTWTINTSAAVVVSAIAIKELGGGGNVSKGSKLQKLMNF